MRSLLKRDWSSDQFDLIYCAGLYDCLPEHLAARLSGALRRLLARDGKLVVGNFGTTSHGRGYMELIMDWRLRYRTESELERCLGPTDDSRTRYFTDPHGNVVYGEVCA